MVSHAWSLPFVNHTRKKILIERKFAIYVAAIARKHLETSAYLLTALLILMKWLLYFYTLFTPSIKIAIIHRFPYFIRQRSFLHGRTAGLLQVRRLYRWCCGPFFEFFLFLGLYIVINFWHHHFAIFLKDLVKCSIFFGLLVL